MLHLGKNLSLVKPLVIDFKGRNSSFEFRIKSFPNQSASLPLEYRLISSDHTLLTSFNVNMFASPVPFAFVQKFAPEDPSIPGDFNGFFIHPGTDLKRVIDVRFRSSNPHIIYIGCEYTQIVSEIFEDNGILHIHSETSAPIP